MSKIGDGIYTTEDGDRIFVGPDVQRFEREDGGEVIVVDPDDATDGGDEE